ncbi:gerT [Symbiodinium pilosum]|uniref:GerT protein n=1 Tax=Symbiodinium pilosum TaxID=2952 RepID=A0A812ISE6_SYMPI|nr:gerT [Symbiodinium pilosum]
MLQGELALVLLMIEAGLHVDMEMIQIVGLRALAVGLIGSFLPMGLGMLVATFALQLELMEAFAVGASMATMSTGIALNVMKAGGVLNQPTGQLVLAAATVNELVNIGLITEIDAIVADGIMLLLVAFMSFLAVKVVPCLLEKVILPRIAKGNRENLALGMLLVATTLCMPACKLTGSSALLGAFLAGFCFCTDEHVHHTWNRQVKRVATFLMRFFFACSIGFTIPVEDFGDAEVWKTALALFWCILGKLAMGVFALPLTKNEFLTLSFAWGSWGEFSFILALRAVRGNLLDGKNYSALVLAVLISIIICPTALRCVLTRSAREANACIELAKHETDACEAGMVHCVYYCLQTRSCAQWGQQGALLSTLAEAGCKIVDFRSFHPFHHVGTQHIVNELYVKDLRLQLVLADQLEPADQQKLDCRIGEILRGILTALHVAEVKIFRWQPGDGTIDLIQEVHHTGLSCSSCPGDPPTHSFRRNGSFNEQLAAQRAHFEMERAVRRHHTQEVQALDDYCYPGTPRAHHELDGYVHTDPHDAFDLSSVNGSESKCEDPGSDRASGTSLMSSSSGDEMASQV